MSIFPTTNNRNSTIQSRLFSLAALVLFLLSLILTLSPAVKLRSWHVSYHWTHWFGFFIWLLGAAIIHRVTIKRFSKWDGLILPTAFLLVGWGMLTIWRLNIVFGARQCLWFILSIALAVLFFRSENFLQTLKQYKYFLLTAGLALAILTFFFGTYPSGEGPNLWLGFKGFYFQPSEPLKIILIIYLAAYFSEKYFLRFNIIETILPTLILVFAALFILVGQRDMGTALIFIVIYIGMLYITFGKKRILVIGALIIAAAAVIGYINIDLIRIRFQAWVQPWLDPQSGSYQIIQSIIAIAAGGVFGSGLGIGYPGLVPVPHSDFIYAAIVEESGLVGSIALISLFAILLYRGIQVALNTNNKFHRFLASGITIYIIFQTILIIGGNIRLLPITGVPLPLVSYGGSSLITTSMAICFLVKISNHPTENHYKESDSIPFRNGALIFSIGLILLALVTGWWAVIRSDDLQLRTDNARNFIASRYVKRGSILDRNGEAITTTSDQAGKYEYEILYEPLSNTIGYFDYNFGIVGLEEAYNDYLSGQRGYPTFNTWFNYLKYDQPLPGLDIKLTLDLNIQEIVDQYFSDYQGAAVVLNASTGEVLAISSSPSYNANALHENWDTWISDENSPLLNRATQGAYPLEGLLTPFLLSQDADLLTTDITESVRNWQWDCAIEEESHPELWSQAVTRGCKNALELAAEDQPIDYLTNIISKFGLNETLDIGLPAITSNIEQNIYSGWETLLEGNNPFRVSPLQVAYAASVFSNHGQQAIPQILSAVNTQQEGWVVVSSTESYQVISSEEADNMTILLASSEIPGWEMSTQSKDEQGRYSWYAAGTPSNWTGAPIVLVMVSENASAEDLRQAGRAIFSEITES